MTEQQAEQTQSVAIVTGGSRGIGRAIAHALTEMGYQVAILYAGNIEAADEALSEGACTLALQCDVANFDEVQKAVNTVKSKLGPVSVLVNNAGITRDALVMRMSPDDFTHVVDINLAGAFHLIRAVTPDMVRRREGKIINISSVSGLMGNAGQANYSASKAGLIGLTKSVAKELAPRGITVNAVAPGFVQTDMTTAMDAAVLASAVQAVPLKRMGTPQDVAAVVAFLSGESASYITGTVIKVDGGLYI